MQLKTLCDSWVYANRGMHFQVLGNVQFDPKPRFSSSFGRVLVDVWTNRGHSHPPIWAAYDQDMVSGLIERAIEDLTKY